MKNSFGNIFRLTSFGESHGAAIGGVIDGMPAGIAIDLDAVQRELDRRRPGQSAIVTARNEKDRVRILSGIFEGVTTGTSIGFIIENENQHSAAMVISTLTGKTVTPVDTCDWSIRHGYKALNQGTYYSYFVPQLKAYGIQCKQMLGSRILNQPQHPIHEQVKQYLSQGYYVIALMGPGTWTKSGHFVLVWDWDSKVRINDPASTRAERLNGDPDTFRREVRMYWLVDAREFNKEEDEVVTYKYLKDIPEKFRPIINDLMTAGIIQGDGSDPSRCDRGGRCGRQARLRGRGRLCRQRTNQA